MITYIFRLHQRKTNYHKSIINGVEISDLQNGSDNPNPPENQFNVNKADSLNKKKSLDNVNDL